MLRLRFILASLFKSLYQLLLPKQAVKIRFDIAKEGNFKPEQKQARKTKKRAAQKTKQRGLFDDTEGALLFEAPIAVGVEVDHLSPQQARLQSIIRFNYIRDRKKRLMPMVAMNRKQVVRVGRHF